MNVLHDIRLAVRPLSKDRRTYSFRKATTGSTRSARRAGIAQPSAPAAISTSATLANVSGWRHANQYSLQDAGPPQAAARPTLNPSEAPPETVD
jgi:hypothetical protein